MEYLTLVDEDGNPTGETKERTLVHRDGDLHATAHVWLVRVKPGGSSAQVLLQKRSAGKDSYPGCYDISSAGHIPAGQDYVSSALRELREELGIIKEEKDLHFVFNHLGYQEAEFYGRPFRNHEFSRVYLCKCGLEPEEMKLQSEEVESVVWADLRPCLEALRDGKIKNCIALDEFERLVPEAERYLSEDLNMLTGGEK